MEKISNEQKAMEIAINLSEFLQGGDIYTLKVCDKAAREAMKWKDKQLADYLQQEWDRCAGACSSIVSAYCRDVERMANDLGIKLKFNNPYIE